MRPNPIIAVVLTITLTAATTAGAAARFDHHSGIPVPEYVTVAKPIMVAQQVVTPSATVIYTYHDGYAQGEGTANGRSNTGSFIGGLAWGGLLGLIGTGVGYFLTGGADPPHADLAQISGRGSDFERGFRDGYRERAKSKARGAKLGGGLLGTLIFVVIVAS